MKVLNYAETDRFLICPHCQFPMGGVNPNPIPNRDGERRSVIDLSPPSPITVLREPTYQCPECGGAFIPVMINNDDHGHQISDNESDGDDFTYGCCFRDKPLPCRNDPKAQVISFTGLYLGWVSAKSGKWAIVIEDGVEHPEFYRIEHVLVQRAEWRRADTL